MLGTLSLDYKANENRHGSCLPAACRLLGADETSDPDWETCPAELCCMSWWVGTGYSE